MKAAIIILSDPKAGGEDALGRMFNGLATAYDFKQHGDDVTILFQGAGTRWAGELYKPNHPAHELYKSLEAQVAGISCGCAEVFGASDAAEQNGLKLIKDNPVPGTSGLPSLRRLSADGYQVMVF